MTLLRIVSGGQTGVDRAALDAALARGVPCGGWCPADRLAEDGPIASKYPLVEPESQDYADRTLANVRDSDGTLILCFDLCSCRSGTMSPGTRLTAEAAKKFGRPLLIAQILAGELGTRSLSEITDWMDEHNISTLNIAGPRESECPGIYAAALTSISNLLTSVARC